MSSTQRSRPPALALYSRPNVAAMPLSVTLTPNGARALRVSGWVSAVLAIALWTGPSLLRADLFNGDATQHVFWLYRYADPTLFPNDLSIEYFASPSSAPIGYRGLYSVLASAFDALLAAKVVACVLLALALALAWRLGAALTDNARPLAGLLAILATVAMLLLQDVLPPMGFQRTFALPTTLLCLWALIERRYVWIGVSWLAAALVYPVLVPVLGIASVVVFLGDLVRERRLPPYWLWNAALGILAIAMVLAASGTPEGVGPMVTYKQALAMPEFGPNGRQDLFGDGSFATLLAHHRTGLGWTRKELLAIVLAVGATVLLGRRRLIPRAAWALAFAGVALWLVARMTLFTLYLPNRHSRLALAAFAIVAFTACCFVLIDAWVAQRPRAAARVPLFVALASPLVVALMLAPGAATAFRTPVDQDMERAYAFIASLPNDTLVAAHPDLADAVPLRTRHSVLASTEESIAFMLGYYTRVVPRVEASLRAAYATSWDELDADLAPYGVDVFLTAPAVWQETGYYAPFDELTHRLIERARSETTVIRSPPAERILFRSGEVLVVRVGPRRDGPTQPQSEHKPPINDELQGTRDH